MREIFYFFSDLGPYLGAFFKYLLLNFGVTSLIITLFYIFTYLLYYKNKCEKVHYLHILGIAFISTLPTFAWYGFFGIKAVLLPIFVFILVIYSTLINVVDD